MAITYRASQVKGLPRLIEMWLKLLRNTSSEQLEEPVRRALNYSKFESPSHNQMVKRWDSPFSQSALTMWKWRINIRRDTSKPFILKTNIATEPLQNPF